MVGHLIESLWTNFTMKNYKIFQAIKLLTSYYEKQNRIHYVLKNINEKLLKLPTNKIQDTKILVEANSINHTKDLDYNHFNTNLCMKKYELG